jgi:GNAT superfamily N-acetyltransferase/uncharacterized glyoxalase superfamily protein PhnB
MGNEENAAFLLHVEPVLAVSNVVQTVEYWCEVLGFRDKWTWGEPPNHGGVTWQGVFIQFSHDPSLASVSKGNSIFIRVKNLEPLYAFHQKKKAEIVEPLENKPWGMAGYTVREINGYYVIFAGAPISTRKKADIPTTQNVKVISRIPTAKEYLELVVAVGWGQHTNTAMVEKILAAPIYAVVAEDETHKVIGCALVLSDLASFCYVKDLMVHPDWQSKGVGSMLMKDITHWLDANAPENAFVGLFTGENLSTFYKQFDFTPAFGMVRRIRKSENLK